MTPAPDPWPVPGEPGAADPDGPGRPDLSSAFGSSAAGSLRGLLAPRRTAVRAVEPVHDDGDTGTAHHPEPTPEEDTVAPPRTRRTRRIPAARIRDRKDVDLLLLAVAREGVANGREFIDLVRERSGGAFVLSERSVYHQLHRLRNERLIRDTGRAGAGRFVLTSLGERILATRVRNWEAFSRGLDRVLADTAPEQDRSG